MSRTPFLFALAAAVLALSPVPSLAEPAPQFGRYLPLYPGLYLDAGVERDERDSSFDRDGRRQPSAAPLAGGQTAFPETRYRLRFNWHFPLFEADGIPFLSSRTHFARLDFSQSQTRTEGALADFVADGSDDATTDTDDLRNHGSGIGDPQFEFGSYLLGSPSPGWRDQPRAPYALLAAVGLRLPFGQYQRDAPISAGNNTAALHLKLAGHWQPWRGGHIDLGYTWREYFQNYDPAFGALDPSNQGDDRIIDLSLAQRLLPGVYLSLFGIDRRGGSNLYENPRFAPNAPPVGGLPPVLDADNYPTAGSYRDGGTALREVGAGLQWFVAQRLVLGLHYRHPESGRSGQFLLPFTDRRPAQCTPGGLGCMTSPGETVLVDGMGAARVYASDRWQLSLNYQFGLGDPYPCAGCKR